jgi:hypothetical protein
MLKTSDCLDESSLEGGYGRLARARRSEAPGWSLDLTAAAERWRPAVEIEGSFVGKGAGMTRIGYHASYEQYPPSAMLALVRRAAGAGIQSEMRSDHFHPWSERQGQSGFAWS